MGNEAQSTVVIPRRFRGPPHSGNGGYVCGLVAADLAHPVEVTLKAPPPLDTPLILRRGKNARHLLHDETELAVARTSALVLDPPSPPTQAESLEAANHYITAEEHLLPECFVCGPLRLKGEALRIFAGPHQTRALAAAPWTPPEEYSQPDGFISREIMWASLDCPGYFGLRQKGLVALLGQMTAEILERPPAGEPCIVAAWRIGGEGRKHFAGTALYGSNGRILAKASAIWVELDRGKFAAAAG